MLGNVVGRYFTSVLPAGDVQGATRTFHARLRGAEAGDITLEVIGADGRPTQLEISSVPLESHHHVIGMFGIAVPRAAGEPRPPKFDGRLTTRQVEVLRQLGEGASTEQIASRLSLSRETVRNHVRHILQRLGARSRLEAVALAHRDGLI
jgi:DNA-binding NarL/FixJ family response regulator